MQCGRNAPVRRRSESLITRRRLRAAVAIALLPGAGAIAASGSWTGAGSDSLWTNSSNWTASPAPTSNETATFNVDVANGTTTPVDLGAPRTIRTVIFDAGAGSYVIGTGASPALSFSSSGMIEIRAGVLNAQRFDAQLVSGGSGSGAHLTITNNALLTSATLNLAGGVSTASAAGQNNTLHLGGSNFGANVVSGVIANHALFPTTNATSRVQKEGTGTWSLTNANSFTGGLVIAGGTLKLDFNAAAAPASNIVNAANALSLGTVVGTNTLQLMGKQDVATTQTLGTWTTNIGASHIVVQGTGTGTMTLNLGNMSTSTRISGGSLDISLGAGGFVTTTQTNHTNGAMFQMVTFNGGRTFAANDGTGNIVGFTNYSPTTASVITTGNTAIMDVSSGVDTSVLTTGTSTLGGLRFNQAQSRTITLGTSRALAVGGGNGPAAILVTPDVGANTSKITGGMVWGISSRDLAILQNNTQGDLLIESNITDVSTGQTMPLTKSGAGRLVLSGKNAYRGPTVLNEGTIAVTSDAVLGNAQELTTTSGSAVINGVDTTGLFVGQRVTGTNVIAGASSTLAILSIGVNQVTLTANVGAGLGGTASVTFSDGGPLGNLAGAVQIGAGAKLQIGNGGTTGSLLAAQQITNNGTVAFNRSDTALQFANAISGGGGVSHEGSGKVTLTGANSYTGETVITAGTLGLSGATNNIASSSRIIVGATRAQSSTALDVTGVTNFAVAANQTLGGHGNVNGAVTVDGAITPGEGQTGILRLNNGVTFNAGGRLAVDVNAPTFFGSPTQPDHDQLRVTGDVSLAGTLEVNFGDFDAVVGNRVLILNNASAGTTTGTFQYGEWAQVGVFNDVLWYISYQANNTSSLDGGNDVVLYAEPVPEPAGLGLIGLGAAGLLRRRRRA